MPKTSTTIVGRPQQPVLVEKVIEEGPGGDATGYVVVVTTRKIVNGEWIKG